jgi:hypothetical protein
MRKHYYVCPDREAVKPVYYRKGVNIAHMSTSEADKDADPAEMTHSLADLQKLVGIIKSFPLPDIPVETLNHEKAEQTDAASATPLNAKHGRQLSSLVAHLEAAGLLTPNAQSFVEFGAGKGHFNYWISMALGKERAQQTSFFFVERQAGRKNKKDGKLKMSQERTVRLLLDIADLSLPAVPELQSGVHGPCVAVGKHLCGGVMHIPLRPVLISFVFCSAEDRCDRSDHQVH